MSDSLSRTPLYNNHLALGARMVPFAGYEMPVQYQGVIEETKACRKAGGLFDVSHMGQFSLKGKNVLALLQNLVTNQLNKVAIGQAQYNFLCNEKGGVIDDIIVYHRSEQEAFLCVNASNRKTDWDWFVSHLGNNLELHDVSDETALIAIQGPEAQSVLMKLAPTGGWDSLNYYWAKDTILCDIPVFASRTGYTGEDGFELYVPSDKAGKLWEVLLEEGRLRGIQPCGLGARDSLRLEMGYPLHGHELSPDITPLQAGLNWAVKLDTVPHFIGREALLKEKTEGPHVHLKALTVQDKRIARQGYEIATLDKQIVGKITSGTFSPHCNSPIALGFVDRTAGHNHQFLIKVRNDWVPAKIAGLPFVPSRVRKNQK
ncbi:MAG: glycine cleavage system aminomethyltransferase GcvT [Proteobacteria bacterium]|nr:glycine cleavage system aminomethyltransferase GcvT [Pseudomonadota bacterium]